MKVEVKVPSVGESVTEALLAEWFKKDGDRVRKDEPLFVIETDKVTLEVVAETDGILSIKVETGETVAIGEVVGTIDTEAAEKDAEDKEAAAEKPEEKKAEKAETPAKEPLPEEEREDAPQASADKEKETAAEKAETPAEEPPPEEEKEAPSKAAVEKEKARPLISPQSLAPSVRNLVSQKNIDVSKIEGTGPGGRITRGDVLLYIESTAEKTTDKKPEEDRKAETIEKKEKPADEGRIEEKQTSRKPMSPIRRRIAARLLEAKQNTAMLTTFNDVDMTRVLALRSQFKESFKEKYGISLGMMSFFIKACVEALKEFPEVNAYIDDKDIVYHHYYHIGVAIGSEKGLVVPVIRHAEQLNFAQLEQAIVDFVNKIKENRLELSDLEGGTFTISNGGVFGSLLSTPILNMPQSGILGMHRIEKRPVALEDQMVIRPMMYLALSYDHRIIDGREAVTFLKRIKECIENPERIMMEI
jgi:2-oxoglutarate dehydrogenase E2 component (dihydrolipoamide succinyltransferase)